MTPIGKVNGVSRGRGYGETNPVASNDTKAGCAKNRRVEIRPLK